MNIDGNKKVNPFTAIFKGTIASTTDLKLQSEEVSEAKWFEIADLKHQITDNPSDFTPTLINAIERYYDKFS